MIIKKYSYSIFQNLDNSQWLDVRSREAIHADPIPTATDMDLYSEIDLKKLRREGFSSAIGKKIMNRIYDATSLMNPKKNLILLDTTRDTIAQAFWQHYQPTHNILIYKGGVKSMLKEAEGVIHQKRRLVVLNGETGTGKTDLLNLLEVKNQQVLNLEKLANHSGSTFGNLSGHIQPSQTTFLLNLALTLAKFNSENIIFSEYESQSLGKNILPLVIEEAFENGLQVRLKLDLEYRVSRLVSQYVGKNDMKLEEGIKSLQSRLGKAKTDFLIEQLKSKNHSLVAEGLLYYFDQSETYKSLDEKTFELTLNNQNIQDTSVKLIKHFS